jgi:hypothetical protein
MFGSVTLESRPGSAPASVRNAFLDLINDETEGEDACSLAAKLTGCTDVLPYEYCEMLELATGSTFGQAALKFRATLGCQP